MKASVEAETSTIVKKVVY